MKQSDASSNDSDHQKQKQKVIEQSRQKHMNYQQFKSKNMLQEKHMAMCKQKEEADLKNDLKVKVKWEASEPIKPFSQSMVEDKIAHKYQLDNILSENREVQVHIMNTSNDTSMFEQKTKRRSSSSFD